MTVSHSLHRILISYPGWSLLFWSAPPAVTVVYVPVKPSPLKQDIGMRATRLSDKCTQLLKQKTRNQIFLTPLN